VKVVGVFVRFSCAASRFCKKRHFKFKPDVIIFIDYPRVYIRIAKWARIGWTHYYISLKYGLGKKIGLSTSNDIDKMYVIHHSKKFYEDKHGFSVEFVGHLN
jgi:lipid-A-disaccharide synthase